VDVGPSAFSLILTQLFNVDHSDVPIVVLVAMDIAVFLGFLSIATASLCHRPNSSSAASGRIWIIDGLNSFFAASWQSSRFSKNNFNERCVFAYVLWAPPRPSSPA
jgi:hypothetical protein